MVQPEKCAPTHSNFFLSWRQWVGGKFKQDLAHICGYFKAGIPHPHEQFKLSILNTSKYVNKINNLFNKDSLKLLICYIPQISKVGSFLRTQAISINSIKAKSNQKKTSWCKKYNLNRLRSVRRCLIRHLI